MALDHGHRADNLYQHRERSGLDARPATAVMPDDPYKKQEPLGLIALVGRALVIQDLRNGEVWRAAIFEGVATFAMLFIGILCTITSIEAGFTSSVMAIAIFQAIVLSLCILSSAPATGGHVNPCITFTEMLTGHISPVRAMLYITGQCSGSILGSLLAKVVVGHTLATKYLLGGCYLKSQTSATSGLTGLDPGRALLIECVLAFFVLFVSYSIALDPPLLPRTGYILAPFIVGGVVGLCIYAGGGLISGYGGAGINPGRCIGPAVALGGTMWNGHWVFWAGAGVAALSYASLYHVIPPTHIEVYKQRKAKRLMKTKKTKLNRFGPAYARTNISGHRHRNLSRLEPYDVDDLSGAPEQFIHMNPVTNHRHTDFGNRHGV